MLKYAKELTTILCQCIHICVLSRFCQGLLRFSSSGFMKGMIGHVRVLMGMRGMLGYVRVGRVVMALRVVRVRGTPRYDGAGTGDAAVRWGWHAGRRGGHREAGGTSGGWGHSPTLPYLAVR